MTRLVEEWIGKTDDAKVPDHVKLRIWRRQCGKDKNFAVCPLSKLPIKDTDEKHLDHIKALIDNGEHRESNLAFVHVTAHRIKTAGEVKQRAKNDAVAKKHLGIKGAPGKLSGRSSEEKEADRKAKAGDRLPIPARKTDIFGNPI